MLAASSTVSPYLPGVSGVRVEVKRCSWKDCLEQKENWPSGGKPRAQPQAVLWRSQGLGLAALQLLGLAAVWLVLICSLFSQSSQDGREQGCEATGPWHASCVLLGLWHERWPGPGVTVTLLSLKHKSCPCSHQLESGWLSLAGSCVISRITEEL